MEKHIKNQHKNLMNIEIKIVLFCFSSIFLLSNCNYQIKKKNIEYLICKDSCQYWSLVSKDSFDTKNIDYFCKDGQVKNYLLQEDNLYHPSSAFYQKWYVSGDSIITLENSKTNSGLLKLKMTECIKDTIYFHVINKNYNENLRFVKIKGRLNFSKDSARTINVIDL